MTIKLENATVTSSSTLEIKPNNSSVATVTISTSGNVGFGGTPKDNCVVDLSFKTDGISLPKGTTAQRPGTAGAGSIRFNTSLDAVEFYNNTNWIGIGIKDGLSPSSAAANVYNIKQTTGTSTDGTYWVVNSTVNSGQPLKVYADMNTAGGGWMLLVNSTGTGWDTSNVLLTQKDNPNVGTGTPYSILSYGDAFKRSSTGFEYMMGASSSGTARANWTSNGYRGTANSAYSFTSTSSGNTNITVNEWFSPVSSFNENNGIGPRMPWLAGVPSGTGAILTTYPGTSSWWGTLVQTDTNRSSYNAGPWISAGLQNPLNIWYWMR